MNPRGRSVALVALLLAGCTTETAAVRETAIPVVSPATSRPATTTTAPTATIAADTAPPQANAPSLPVPQTPPAPDAIEPVVALGTIEIPRIGLNTSLFEGITLTTFDRGPGHWPGSALPGAMGNVVVGGHRTSKSRPFRHLEQLAPGDEVIFTTDAGRYVYHVMRTEIVTPDAMWIIDQTEAYTATLFSCNPVGSTKERIVVFLELGV